MMSLKEGHGNGPVRELWACGHTLETPEELKCGKKGVLGPALRDSDLTVLVEHGHL